MINTSWAASLPPIVPSDVRTVLSDHANATAAWRDSQWGVAMVWLGTVAAPNDDFARECLSAAIDACAEVDLARHRRQLELAKQFGQIDALDDVLLARSGVLSDLVAAMGKGPIRRAERTLSRNTTAYDLEEVAMETRVATVLRRRLSWPV